MCLKHTVLDAGAESFKCFRELIASSVIGNIVRDNIEHQIYPQFCIEFLYALALREFFLDFFGAFGILLLEKNTVLQRITPQSM
jgi:hypothetical protein